MHFRTLRELIYTGNVKLACAYGVDFLFKTDIKQKIYAGMSLEEYKKIVERRYREETGKELDLVHPKTFNDKVNWLKLYDATPLKTQLSDKYLVRNWVREKIGEEYLIPLIGVYNTFEEICFSDLPNQFVLKCNHGCAWNIVVKDKAAFDIRKAEEKVNKWMHTNYAFIGFELQYRDIVPKIIIEKYIEQMDGDLLDYKFHCFNGNPELVEVMGERVPGTHIFKQAVMKMDWTKNDGESLITSEKMIENPQKPDNFDKMVEIARILSADFPYVRVDLYNMEGKILFGEMTFTPANGMDPTDEYFTYSDRIPIPAQTRNSVSCLSQNTWMKAR